MRFFAGRVGSERDGLRISTTRSDFRTVAPSAKLLVALLLGGICCGTASAANPSLVIENYATMPQTGTTAFPAPTANSAYLARVNFMADDPNDSGRFFVNDLNGPLYTLDKNTRNFTEYLNFNGRGGAPGLFDRLWTSAGFAGGFVTFQFDPDYAHNGKFYTVHIEQGGGSQIPSNANHPGLDTSNYGVTAPVPAPGPVNYQSVLVEWTDTNISDSTFQGSARELLRLDAPDRIHPIGDIIFNPTAGPGDPDWRMMYVSVGDAGNGENSDPTRRRTPQLLSTLGGKILRIAPDTNVNIPTTTSPNGKYEIPNDNPFTGIANGEVRDEIWALGLRNPHRMTWDVDPNDSNPATNNHLIVSDIGLHTWEEVNIIHKGGNYGYSYREGNEMLGPGPRNVPPLNVTGPLPNPDLIPNEQICAAPAFTSCTSNGTVTPIYPVIEYGHGLAGQDQMIAGDSISDGFVYRGSKIPALYGKFVFGDITTGVLYYADFAEMVAADDGDPSTLAAIHPLDVLWDNPDNLAGQELFTTLFSDNAIRGPMFQIAEAAYEARGGQDPNLPGGASVTGAFGRADIRIQIGADGEPYILSKSDGMIRSVIGWAPVPEPATAAMLAIAGAMLFASARRHRKEQLS
jgi:Glucose / Sorbosone dehydrogenase/PEP-CTERM motif